MFTLFKKDIERQKEHYVKKKGERSVYAANNQDEWITSFIEVIGCDSIFDIKKEDLDKFVMWVNERFNGSAYCKQESRRAILGFLKFYKYDIM